MVGDGLLREDCFLLFYLDSNQAKAGSGGIQFIRFAKSILAKDVEGSVLGFVFRPVFGIRR